MVAFGRRPEFDERSRNYPIRTLLGPKRIPHPQIWGCGVYLDQGNIGACVGFSWGHELIAEPEIVPDVHEDYAFMLYHDAQRLDEWEGEDYEGTSVLAGAKAVVQAGWIQEYRWAFSLDDVLETLTYLGPVILGLNWYEGMLDTNPDGYIFPTGDIVGGHAILARGVQPQTHTVLLHNSWGKGWGQGGTCLIDWTDLDRLLHEQGEACVPVVRTQVITDDEPIIPPEPEPEPSRPGCIPTWLKNLFK